MQDVRCAACGAKLCEMDNKQVEIRCHSCKSDVLISRTGTGLDMKFLEIRDSATCIPALAIKLNSADETYRYFLKRAGYSLEGMGSIELIKLSTGEANYDPFCWDGNSRTMRLAHVYIKGAFDALVNGEVVDVEYILGETKEPKVSERGE